MTKYVQELANIQVEWYVILKEIKVNMLYTTGDVVIQRLAIPPRSTSLDYKSIEGLAESVQYGARLPYPSNCLGSIDAALYFYDRKISPQNDRIFLISHGYTWM